MALPDNKEEDITTTSTSSRRNNVKTIIFIRHAQSEENHRLGSMRSACCDVAHFTLPKASQVRSGLGWLYIPAQLNSKLTKLGHEQVADVAHTLRQANLLKDIELVVHSPLLRARDTCQGIFGCTADTDVDGDALRVMELKLLEEKSPREWLKKKRFEARVRNFENWLYQQPEETICLVGHSLYFKTMLKVDFKFSNCDVWRACFEKDDGYDAHDVPARWTNLEKLHVCNVVSDITLNESLCRF